MILEALGDIFGFLKPFSKEFFEKKRKRIRIKIEVLKEKKLVLLKKPATVRSTNKIYDIIQKINKLERSLIQE